MKKSKIFTVPFRRKKEGRTNYKKRLALLLSNKPRLVIRKSLKNVTAQIVTYDSNGDRIITAAHSSELRKRCGWSHSTGNIPAAYLTGLLLGKKAADKDIKEAILDIGLQKSVVKGRIYAALKGALDAGMGVPHSEKVLPDEKRISGEHIKSYAEKAGQENKTSQFSALKSSNVDVSSITAAFNDCKKKILEE
ncbi:50S ribosomal protein L18 [Candidatus Woesearchaeota archaeon]|nr:50S ribosomal protein L18 [Candidatus Woesearchaeota archaeon]